MSSSATSPCTSVAKPGNAAFPGFATDVHGLVGDDETEPGKPKRYYVDCVKS